MKFWPDKLMHLPGGELASAGLREWSEKRPDVNAYLLLMIRDRLAELGIRTPKPFLSTEKIVDFLWNRMVEYHGRQAHNQYMARLERIEKFARFLRKAEKQL